MSGLPTIILSLDGRIVPLYNIRTSQTVKSLRKILELATNISVHKQVLLNRHGLILDDNNPVIAYAEQNIYLFDKAHFVSNREVPLDELPGLGQVQEFEELEIDQITFPDHLSKAQENVRAQYGKGFYIQLERMQAVLKCAQARAKFCKESLQEQKNQIEAIRAALNNLDGHCISCQRNVKEFVNAYRKDEERFQFYIKNFDESLEELSTIALHEALSEKKMTLRECIPEKPLRDWLSRSEREMQLFSERVKHGESFSMKILKWADMEKLDLSPLEKVFSLQDHQKQSQETLNKITHSLKSMEHDFGALFQTFNSKEPLDEDTQAQLDKYAAAQAETYIRSKNSLQNLYDICTECSKSKKKITEMLVKKLKSVSEIQVNIKKLNHKLATFRSVLKSINHKFRQVELIYNFPAAYSLSILEVIRRREFLMKFQGEIQRSKKRIHSMRKEEIEREKIFQLNVARYIPPKLIPAITEYTPDCKIELGDIRYKLPEISKTSVSVSKEELQTIRKLFGAKLGSETIQEYADLLNEEMHDDELLFDRDSPLMHQQPMYPDKDCGDNSNLQKKIDELQNQTKVHLSTIGDQEKELQRLRMSNSVNEKIRMQCTLENNQIKRDMYNMKEKVRSILETMEDKQVDLSDLKGELLALLNPQSLQKSDSRFDQ